MRMIRFAVPVVILGLAITFGAGCAAFRQSTENVDVNKSQRLSAKYEASDLLIMSSEMVGKLLETSFMQNMKEAPLVAFFDIENRTTMHIDTQAMADTIQQKFMDLEKMRFINTERRDALLKEQAYQGKESSEETRVAVGKQLGAKYMMTGSLVELTKQSGRQVRVSSKKEIYYQLTVKITDMKTGEVLASKQFDRACKQSDPLIGW